MILLYVIWIHIIVILYYCYYMDINDDIKYYHYLQDLLRELGHFGTISRLDYMCVYVIICMYIYIYIYIYTISLSIYI